MATVQYTVIKKLVYDDKAVGFVIMHPLSGYTRKVSRRLLIKMVESGEIYNLATRSNPNGIEPILFGIRGTQIENLPYEIVQDKADQSKNDQYKSIEINRDNSKEYQYKDNIKQNNIKDESSNLRQQSYSNSQMTFDINYIMKMYIRLLESPLTAYYVSNIRTDIVGENPAILFRLSTEVQKLEFNAIIKFINARTGLMLSFEVYDDSGKTLVARSTHGEDTGVIIGNVYGIARNN